MTSKRRRKQQIEARKRDAEPRGGTWKLPKKPDALHRKQDAKAEVRIRKEKKAVQKLTRAHISDRELERIRREIAKETHPG